MSRDPDEIAKDLRRIIEADQEADQLEEIRRMIEGFDTIDAIDDDMRALIEERWPWLLSKLPPQRKH